MLGKVLSRIRSEVPRPSGGTTPLLAAECFRQVSSGCGIVSIVSPNRQVCTSLRGRNGALRSSARTSSRTLVAPRLGAAPGPPLPRPAGPRGETDGQPAQGVLGLLAGGDVG